MIEPALNALSPMEITALEKAIAHRRSIGVKRMSKEPVPQETVQRLLNAANWAPSHGDTEPWRFVVFMGEGREKLAELFCNCYQNAKPGDENMELALKQVRDRVWKGTVWIALGLEPGLLDDGSLKMPIQEERLAVGCAVQNMHLVASALGLASMWHSKGSSVDPFVADALGWEKPCELLGFFQVGWPAEPWPEGERGPIEDKVRFVLES